MDKQLCPERRIEEEEEEEEEEDCSIDRISELPQSILHHILCFLYQREAIQTCVLSKSWRYLGSTRPKIEFRDTSGTFYLGTTIEKIFFMPALEQILQRCHDQALAVQDFCLKSHNLDLDSSVSLLQKWIPIVLMNMGVKKFSLYSMYTNFDMPSVIFQAESLQELRLRNCVLNKISSTDKVMFKNLHTLSLSNVSIEEETFEKIMSSCPLIQCLVIRHCVGLRAVKVCNARNLKFICFEDRACSIEIDVPSTLETVRIPECTDCFLYNNNNMYFTHIKSFYLGYKTLSAKSFAFFSCYFPCLEKLELYKCHVSEGFQLSIPSIKRLNLHFLSAGSITAAIDAPNIQYFEFCCSHHLPSITFAASNQWESSRIVLPNSVFCDATWLLKLNELLKALSRSQIYLEMEYLASNDHQEIEDTCGGGYKPVVVEHLSLSGDYFDSCFQAVLNCLLHTCRPRYIGMDFFTMDDSSWLRFLRRKQGRIDNRLAEIIKGEMSLCYLWKQDLDELSIQVIDENGKEWHPVQGTGFLESAVSNQHKILLRLRFLSLA